MSQYFIDMIVGSLTKGCRVVQVIHHTLMELILQGIKQCHCLCVERQHTLAHILLWRQLIPRVECITVSILTHHITLRTVTFILVDDALLVLVLTFGIA